MTNNRALVIIPTYNELENIPKLIPIVPIIKSIMDNLRSGVIINFFQCSLFFIIMDEFEDFLFSILNYRLQ